MTHQLTKRFMPIEKVKQSIYRVRIKGFKFESDNFGSRIKWYPAGWKVNNKVIGNQHSNLHYLAWHAPIAVRKKYETAYINFRNKHFGYADKASVRYLNKWSCHSWL